jgi:uncharacterized protein (DUF2236 family)
MHKTYFVQPDSIVRKIWSKSDVILLIFSGSAAEFALNKAVDWLYFTGRLPADPLGRLFSTVQYARSIVFSEYSGAVRTIEKMNQIHGKVEAQRGMEIPDWAYRDVLYMLIDYSIRSYEALYRQMDIREKEEVYDVFLRMGRIMNIPALPEIYDSWLDDRSKHMDEDLAYSSYTRDLFQQYRKHLGAIRYRLLIEGQILVLPERARKLLDLRAYSLLRPVVPIYKLSRLIKADAAVRELILPSEYMNEIRELDHAPG